MASEKKSIGYHLNALTELLREKNATKTTSDQFSMFPITDVPSYNFFKLQEKNLWQSNELDFVRDKKDYEGLPENQKRLINMILSFFSPGDGLISENIILRFLLECDSYQQQAMFIAQLYIELVHAETYGLTIFTIIPEKDRREVFEACNHLPCVAAKTKFMEKYMYSDEDRCIRFAAFAIAEGIFFSMLFSIIFWFRSQGKLATLISSNEQISKDEGLHRDFGCMLFKKYGGERFKDQVLQMVQEALKIESDFVDEMLPEPIGDLNKEDIKTYGTIVADNLLVEMGFQKFWNRSHPENLKWMNDISLPQKNNFYEIMVASYNQFSSKDIEGRLKIGKNETAEETTKKEEEEIDF